MSANRQQADRRDGCQRTSRVAAVVAYACRRMCDGPRHQHNTRKPHCSILPLPFTPLSEPVMSPTYTMHRIWAELTVAGRTLLGAPRCREMAVAVPSAVERACLLFKLPGNLHVSGMSGMHDCCVIDMHVSGVHAVLSTSVPPTCTCESRNPACQVAPSCAPPLASPLRHKSGH